MGSTPLLGSSTSPVYQTFAPIQEALNPVVDTAHPVVEQVTSPVQSVTNSPLVGFTRYATGLDNAFSGLNVLGLNGYLF